MEKTSFILPLHFTPSFGWMNDPNGLVFHDGIYELYYQHNPKGIDWNCMTWGHARGTNLYQWNDLGDVMEPDENGPVFSGSAIRNDHGCLGLPKDALIFFYTAAGHYSLDSAGKPYTIRLAYSIDGGNTLIKRDGILSNGAIIESLASENRDPKVFWHDESGAYILVLWLEENDFGIWRSDDLEHFTMTQRLTLNGGNECPDLFLLPVSNACDEARWVFWVADGFYYVGSFDGYEFRQEQERKSAYIKGPDGMLSYAAQTWSGIDKVLSVSWLRTKCVGRTTTGMMSIPKEFYLIRKGEVDILQQRFPVTVTNLFEDSSFFSGACYGKANTNIVFPICCTTENLGMHEETMEWEISLLCGDDAILVIECQRSTKKLFFTHGIVTDFCDAACEMEDLEFIFDHGILELLANEGTFYLAVDFPELRGKNVDRIVVSGNLLQVR